jgi:nucleoside-diphosphate-sugar epimerase
VSTLIVGCGYLGRRVGVLLRTRGEQVAGTARSAARAGELAALGIEPVVADVLDGGSLRGLPKAERVVYCVGFDRSARASLRTVYIDGLENVLGHLTGPVSRLVYASSTGVYGQTGGEWVDEHSLAAPPHESGKLCLEAEQRIRAWSRHNPHGSAIVLRLAGLYGPERVVRRAYIERGDTIVGDPDRFLNLIHIDDAASAVAAAVEAVAAGELYLISDDRPVTRREYYCAVAAQLGAREPRFEPPQPGSLEESRDAANKRVANQRMKRELGVVLQYPNITTGLPAALRSGKT